MLTEIIKIGNSKGLRIPKAVLEQCQMKSTVNLIVEDQKLIITPYESVRAGWEEKFYHMAEQNEDHLLDSDSIRTSWDEEEWQW